jgi:hypothetical protein
MTAPFAQHVAEEEKASPTTANSRRWLRSGRELLEQPDPGPVDWLIEELLVEQALGVIQGHYKAGKSWLGLELAVAIVTGRDALGRFAVPHPGAVIMVLEESPERETHRRLDQLRRAHSLSPEAVTDLHLASNQGVRLDPGSEWRERLVAAAKEIKPRAVICDPLVRLKGGEIDENVQREIVQVLDFISELRREAGCAVIFSHHVGHKDRGRMRGSSDLEAFWSSKIVIEGEKNPRKLSALHRDAAPTEEYGWDLRWHEQSQSMRVEVAEGRSASQKLRDKLLSHVQLHPGESGNAVWKAVGGRKERALEGLRKLGEQGHLEEHDSGWYPRPTGGSQATGTGRNRGAVPTLGNRLETEPLDLGPQSGKDRFPDHGNHREPGPPEGGSRGDPPYGGNRAEPTEPERRWGTARKDDGQGDLVDTADGVLARFPGTREEVS